MIFAGVDWAGAHHDVLLVDAEGRRLGGGRLPEGVEGIARFHELAARHAEEPGEVVIGVETDRGLFVAALVAAGYQVFAVNPMSTSRYRAGTRSPARSPIRGTRRCWRTWSAPTGTTTGRLPWTATWLGRSRSWPGRISR